MRLCIPALALAILTTAASGASAHGYYGPWYPHHHGRWWGPPRYYGPPYPPPPPPRWYGPPPVYHLPPPPLPYRGGPVYREYPRRHWDYGRMSAPLPPAGGGTVPGPSATIGGGYAGFRPPSAADRTPPL